MINYSHTVFVCHSAGANVDAARKILEDSGLPIQTAQDMDTAAKKAVSALV